MFAFYVEHRLTTRDDTNVPSEENKMRPELHGAWPVVAFGSDGVVTGGAFFK